MRSRFRPRARRLVQLTVAFTMLAVPASAFALPTTTSAETHSPSTLAVRVTPHDVGLGHSIHVDGQVPRTLAGQTVALEAARSARGHWRRLASTRIGAGGRYQLRVAMRQSSDLRAVELSSSSDQLAAAQRGSTDSTAAVTQPAAVSHIAAVQVRASMRVSSSIRDVSAGTDAAIAGQLLPGQPGRTVQVQDHVGHGWRSLGHGLTGRRGGFAVRVAAAGAANHGLRVVFAGDRLNGRATAGAGSIAVFEPVLASWYADGGHTACGFHAAYGVANKTLPCGTKVRLRHGGHTVTATVDDRGPYVAGRDFDLDQSTASALGFSGVGTVDASVE
jgi:rare lipoprotein A